MKFLGEHSALNQHADAFGVMSRYKTSMPNNVEIHEKKKSNRPIPLKVPFALPSNFCRAEMSCCFEDRLKFVPV